MQVPVAAPASPDFKETFFHGIHVFGESSERWRNRLDEQFANTTSPVAKLHTLNPEILAHALRIPRYHAILAGGTWNLVDGVWLAASIAVRKGVWIPRRCGSDLVYDLIQHCRNENRPFFILGGSQQSMELARANACSAYPGLVCEGFSPSFGATIPEAESTRIADLLRELRPGAIAVCLGAPRQEAWIRDNESLLNECGVRVAAGLGGTVDFMSGKIPRAPRWVRALGFEWLFRSINEPARFKRYYHALPALLAAEKSPTESL